MVTASALLQARRQVFKEVGRRGEGWGIGRLPRYVCLLAREGFAIDMHLLGLLVYVRSSSWLATGNVCPTAG
jgi:hypothetical protein